MSSISKITIENCISVIFICSLFALNLVFRAFNWVEMTFIFVLITFLVCVLVLFRNYKKNIWALCFMLSFFTFLLGNISVNLLFSKGIQLSFSNEGLLHISTSLGIGLTCFCFGYLLFSNKKMSTAYDKNDKTDNNSIVQRASKNLFFIMLPFAVAVSIEKALFVSGNSYTAYYLEFSSILPGIIGNLAKVYEVAFFVFLATLPGKKQTMPVLIVNLFVSTLSLSYGQRNGFILAIIITVGYLLWRNIVLPKGEVWITRKEILLIIVITPILISVMYAFNTYRDGLQTSVNGVINRVFAFFDELGGSVKVIGYGYEYQAAFNPDINYTLSQITRIITDNKIYAGIFGTTIYQGQNIQNALYGSNYGGTLTYLVMPYNYLAGIGLGSSYIAEAYHDFGYLGVAFISFLYGFIVEKISLGIEKSPYWGGVIFLMMKDIIYAPRYSALYFIVDTLSVTVILSLILILIMSKLIVKNGNQEQRISISNTKVGENK